ncbi:pseudouridine synthase [Streptomyces fuscigenes]|uniref:pseudouridine synthase n=1 Tax=Streptomyces fuscigenes TaxID=1528880 RepID=UPI001F3C62CF|nr:pseudouridine synthase [Streptomyces fuscigenes]MCF3962754.1 pseudouridine synthase [Streptomyces fuscigenes]
MVRRHRTPASPLPQREGVDAVRVRLPGDPEGRWDTVAEHLAGRYGRAAGAGRVEAMVAEGRFVTSDGRAVTPATPYTPGLYVFFHRDLPPEEPLLSGVDVVHRDERIVVADKPHFLATTPRGGHVARTAVAHLRRTLGLPALQPAHRLDRLTAGLVLFVVRPADRGAYQRLFAERRVSKEYEAVAAHDPGLVLPRTVRSRIEKERGVLAAHEVPGAAPNSETRVEQAVRGGGLGGYRLFPATGRTHQLRVHMNSLGLPLLYDPLYPLVLGQTPDDPERPLQLLARAMEFTDPLTGREHRFTSGLRLARWPGA